jgi:hypothetical protein
MTIKTPTAKTVFKSILYFALSVIFIIAAWAAYIYFRGDEKPEAGRDAFYAVNEKPVPNNQNLAIAITGLNALEGKDSIKHGRFLIEASKNDLTRDAARFLANGPAKLNFVGKRDEFDCWLDDKLGKTAINCASVERLKALLLANKTLLDRYQQLYTMPNWQGSTFSGGQTIIDINVLLAAVIKLDVDEGRPEIAYKKWRDNFVFISRALAAKNTMIERTIFLVADSLSLKSIENVLLKSPEISTQHYDELQYLLNPSGLDRYNIKNMLRADYEFINNEFTTKQQHIYYVHPNFIRNRIYRMQLDFYESAQKSQSTFAKTSERFNQQYKSQNIFNINLCDPFNSYLANKIVGGLPIGFELIKSMHHHNATMSALNLLTKIRVNNIESANIQAFINKAGPRFNNPFTEKPLQWNAEKAAIIYQNPSLKEYIEFKLYL